MARVLSGPALPLALGPNVMAFRELFKKTYGGAHAVTASSGTTAIHIALAAAGVKPGDEVVTSPITDYGTISGIFQLNAVPVFCDVIDDGLVMSPASLETCITKRTRALIPVHIGGYPADMPAIMRIARRHRLKVVEDCAQAHLAKIGKTPLGCFGDFGAFSTNESKHLKSGEGGIVLCRREADAFFMELFADKCYHRFPDAPLTPAFPALNARMSDIAAVIATEQLKKLPGWIARRHAAGLAAEKIIARYPCVLHDRPRAAWCSYWFCVFRLDNLHAGVSTADFEKSLRAEGIPCFRRGPEILPEWELFRKLDRNPRVFANYRPGTLKKGFYRLDQWPRAKYNMANFMMIPINQYTGESELRDLDRALEKIFSACSLR